MQTHSCIISCNNTTFFVPTRNDTTQLIVIELAASGTAMGWLADPSEFIKRMHAYIDKYKHDLEYLQLDHTDILDMQMEFGDIPDDIIAISETDGCAALARGEWIKHSQEAHVAFAKEYFCGEYAHETNSTVLIFESTADAIDFIVNANHKTAACKFNSSQLKRVKNVLIDLLNNYDKIKKI